MNFMFGQTFSLQDLGVIAMLVALEALLSIDNALVLGLLASRLPKRLQSKALTYGLIGAFIFRVIAIGAAAWLLRWHFVKLLGGGYLVWVSAKHFFFEDKKAAVGPGAAVAHGQHDHADFWKTVAVIEMTDIAFAVDSILAAIALVGSAPPGTTGPHPKLWVIIIGGMLGVLLMRVAAMVFIRLLERFPRFETSAYLLVAVIGSKLLADWGFNTPGQPERLNFQEPGSPVFWAFWGLMLVCFLAGFIPKKTADEPSSVQ